MLLAGKSDKALATLEQWQHACTSPFDIVAQMAWICLRRQRWDKANEIFQRHYGFIGKSFLGLTLDGTDPAAVFCRSDPQSLSEWTIRRQAISGTTPGNFLLFPGPPHGNRQLRHGNIVDQGNIPSLWFGLSRKVVVRNYSSSGVPPLIFTLVCSAAGALLLGLFWINSQLPFDPA